MKFLFLSMLLLATMSHGLKLVVKSAEPKDVFEDIFKVFKGWLDSWGEEGEDVKNVTLCVNSTHGVVNIIKNIVKIIKEGDFSAQKIIALSGELFLLTKVGLDGYFACIEVPPLFLEIVKRFEGKTAMDIVERILTRIHAKNEELWAALKQGIEGIINGNYYGIGYGFGKFIEVILLKNDE